MNVFKSLQPIGQLVRGRKLVFLAIAVIISGVIPQPLRGQFLPSPCCAILAAGLGSIASAITNVIGGGLNAINTTMSSIEEFERGVVWPQELIDEARAAVASVRGMANQIRGIAHVSPASASLPATQQLERTLLAANSNSMGNVDPQYAAVYSALPPASDATEEVRDLIDMTDATAQAAMKRAMAIDEIADLEIQAADRIIQEVQAAAPGSAPILEAGAAAWLVRANAYTQAALTELMRLRAIDLAAAGAEMKIDAQRSAKVRGNMNDVLKRN